jgi:alpha-beta hydrolase superfamily lysophospholipase
VNRSRSSIALACVVVVATVLVAGCDDGSTNESNSGAPTTTSASGLRRLIAPNGLRGVLARERRARRESSSTTSSTSPTTTTTTLPPSAPFPVAQTSFTFVDPSRPTAARGGAPAHDGRTLVTTVYYPTTTAPTAENPTPPAAGTFPLVVFAHGYEIDAAAYATLLRDVAIGGYVVAAPDFPGTSTALSGGAVRPDTLQQPDDLSFVITSMLQTSAAAGPLHDAVDPNAIGDSGHSDGGVTALATAHNTCCIDPRIHAATILTGGAFGFEGQWFPPGAPPVMFVHATADEINPYSASTSMFAQAQSPKYLLTVEGGSHLEVFVDPPWEPQIAQAMIAFYDLHLKHDPGADARLQTVGYQPGLLSLQAG